MKKIFLFLFTLAGVSACNTPNISKKDPSPVHNWQKLNTVEYKGKQDDIFFVNSKVGWYGNGQGYIYKTTDGGLSWKEMFHQTGTFVRALGFIDEKIGFAGNIGPDYFPGVTDDKPLYQTKDGGISWTPIKAITGKMLKGVCAIDVLKSQFINSGVLDNRVTIRAAGRVGGPAKMATSRDGGKTWKTQDLSNLAGMILDVKFVDEATGFICAASHPSSEKSKGRILKTSDGGDNWKMVYESKGPNELVWKCSFPSDQVGYGTLQSYDQNPKNTQRYVVKTTDGGNTWKEIPLVNDHSVKEFGIGFLNETTGWVGAFNGGYFTNDGGNTWQYQDIGRGVNKFRIIEDEENYTVFAIGVDVRKLVIPK
jgi:photosystem II stability/assembly factor-like uncharacterized protein